MLFKNTIKWFLTKTGVSCLISLFISEDKTDSSSSSFYLIKNYLKCNTEIKCRFNYIKLFSALYSEISIFKSIWIFRQKINCTVLLNLYDFMYTLRIVDHHYFVTFFSYISSQFCPCVESSKSCQVLENTVKAFIFKK